MSKEWVIEKSVYKKCINKYFLNLIKIFMIILPILLILSLFFVLVGIFDDPEAFDYGIPCTIAFVILLCIIIFFYVLLYVRFIRNAKNTTFKFIFHDKKSIRYFINNSGEYQLNKYKLYCLKNYYFIYDYINKIFIPIPKKEIEDIPELIQTVQNNSCKKILIFKCYTIIAFFLLVIFFTVSFIITSKTTTKFEGVYSLEYAQDIKLVQQSYPKDSIQKHSYIDLKFYYFNETYKFIPDRKPELCILSLQYNEDNYKEVINDLSIPSEYYYKAGDYEFFLSSNSQLFPQSFSMIVLNENENIIIFLGFNDKTSQYPKMIEEDFLKFINKVYGKYYDFKF